MNRDNWKNKIDFTAHEAAFFEKNSTQGGLQVSITPYYASLLKNDPQCPIRRQCVPTDHEFIYTEDELADPLGEQKHSPFSRLIHRYPDRGVILVTDRCAVYCRHCFRKRFTATGRGVISNRELKEIAGYLKDHDEIFEVLLTGGDPLTLSNSRIKEILEVIKEARPDIVIRIGTRIPVVDPAKISETLVSILQTYGPVWILTQFNHPVEITPESARGLRILINGGIPVLNQAVLLQGVNDSVDILAELSHTLVFNRVKPYYLFQGDLIRGTSHLRVPIDKGMELVRELRKRLSGLAMPQYAVDLPDGGGKVPLTESYIIEETKSYYFFKNREGDTYKYPRD